MTGDNEARMATGSLLAALKATAARRAASTDTGAWTRASRVTVPLVVAGALTVTMNLTAPIPAAHAAPKKAVKPPKNAITPAPAAVKAPTLPSVAPASAPASYKVAAGDTVSSIAQRFGVSTAGLLAANGLGWKSLIFPGQVLKIGGATPSTATTAPAAATPASGRYTIKAGDTVGAIAARFGTTTQAVLSANGLSWTSIIYPGQTLAIPGGISAVPASNVTPVPSTGSSTPAVPAPATKSYTIRTGDTVSSIAASNGISVQALMDANGLTGSAVIFAGRTLTIPAITSPAVAQDGTSVTPLSAEMAANARVIIRVGRELGVSDRGIVIALAAAMQESSLRNIAYGDRDSVGLFQQRPSQNWGAKEKLLDTTYAARLFYGGPKNPNAGITRGLLEIPGWQSMSLTQAAQAVQISAYPNAYARWEKSATAWLKQLG